MREAAVGGREVIGNSVNKRAGGKFGIDIAASLEGVKRGQGEY